jgi:outer membrane receptor protein involved in Fe transport
LWQATDTVSVEPFMVFAAEQDRLSARDIRDPRVNPDGTAGWVTANLRASWDLSDTWQLSASVENLLDKRYRVHGSGIDSVGRNLFVSVRSGW